MLKGIKSQIVQFYDTFCYMASLASKNFDQKKLQTKTAESLQKA